MGRDHEAGSPGKIFVGGLLRGTSLDTFVEHFGKYGAIKDNVIIEDKATRQQRGFGFITYEDPAVVDKVIEDSHVINGKQVEIKRTIPKGSVQVKDFKTKKIFVGGLPQSVTEDEFKKFFAKYGKVVESQIMRDRSTNRSRGFGFIVFDSEHVVDVLLRKGKMIDFAGSKVEIKKAEPKKSANPFPATFGNEHRAYPYGDEFGGFDSSHSGYGGGGFGPVSNRMHGNMGSRFGGYDSYLGGVEGAGEFGGGYSSFGGGLRVGGVGYSRGDTSLDYSGRFRTFADGYSGGFNAGALGGNGSEGVGSYGRYDYGPSTDYGSSGGLPGKWNYGGGSGGRYHPYSR